MLIRLAGPRLGRRPWVDDGVQHPHKVPFAARPYIFFVCPSLRQKPLLHLQRS